MRDLLGLFQTGNGPQDPVGELLFTLLAEVGIAAGRLDRCPRTSSVPWRVAPFITR